MKRKILTSFLAFGILFFAFFEGNADMNDLNFTKLNAQEKAVIEDKATEAPFKGKYDNFYENGIYVCKRCLAPLYRSENKFDAGCGWPAFDDAFSQAVRQTRDADGKRTEITCARCGAHLGHVFVGEKLTPKNVRHCVNSISMDFIEGKYIGRAVVAGGCFWGVEDLMRRQKGVIAVVSGYCGGRIANPSYRQVCSGMTGHLESVEILFDKRKTNYSNILRTFFEIHDFTQIDGQGHDIGEQYKSAIFFQDAEQKKCAEEIIAQLRQKGFKPATKILPACEFYPAEEYHQRYYERKGTLPYCHRQRKIF